ncbi:Hypothetical predicted protein [Pelobates cultripes]|uniref:Uncharacterized protein n=1 Tax=Pelobates cultripes TaxID=61616 RepID=A0AAD1RL68_PELCU|nr:Hypothetical predicted protein [Pelobates cultripes]
MPAKRNRSYKPDTAHVGRDIGEMLQRPTHSGPEWQQTNMDPPQHQNQSSRAQQPVLTPRLTSHRLLTPTTKRNLKDLLTDI